jgi:hypothetical protein
MACADYGRVRRLPQSLLSECRPGDMSWHAMTAASGGRTDGATMPLFRRHIDAEATALAWTRTVDIEQQQWVSKRSGWQPSGETRNVQRHQETYWETVTDWQPGPPDADGTPGPQQSTTRQELRTRTFYIYEALEWREDRNSPPRALTGTTSNGRNTRSRPESVYEARPRPTRSRSPGRPSSTRRPSTRRGGARLHSGPPTGSASASWDASAT